MGRSCGSRTRARREVKLNLIGGPPRPPLRGEDLARNHSERLRRGPQSAFFIQSAWDEARGTLPITLPVVRLRHPVPASTRRPSDTSLPSRPPCALSTSSRGSSFRTYRRRGRSSTLSLSSSDVFGAWDRLSCRCRHGRLCAGVWRVGASRCCDAT